MKTNSYLKSIALCQKQAAFNTDAALHNLQNALRCGRGSWEGESYLAHAILFQRKAAAYAADARRLLGVE